jgi:hypothetical protein
MPSSWWFLALSVTDPNPSRQLERLHAELHAAVAGLETILADPGAEGFARLGDDGQLIVSPLPAEQVPVLCTGTPPNAAIFSAEVRQVHGENRHSCQHTKYTNSLEQRPESPPTPLLPKPFVGSMV